MYSQKRKSVAISSALLALALGASACSSTADPEPNNTSAPATSSPSTESSPSASTGTDSASASIFNVKSSGDPFMDAKEAANHMPMSAAALAAGFAEAKDLGSTTTPAAELRSGLGALLQEHVYLAGIAVDTAYVAGADSAEFKAAAATLDENSVALADAVGSLSTPEDREAFLNLWREHIGFFVDYAVAKKTGDEAAAQEAQKELLAYTKDAGAFFEKVSKGNLPADAVSKELVGHIETLSAAIDGFAAGDPKAFNSLHDAAQHVVMSSKTLSGGLAKAANLEGSTDDPAAELRATLTTALQEHVYLAGISVFTAYTAEGGTEGPMFKAAAAELDENSVALADAVGSLSTPEDREAFLNLWREHIGFFVDYAVAAASDDEAGKEQALDELAQYIDDSAAFFSKLSGGTLEEEVLAETLTEHVNTLAGAIDSMKGALVK